VRLKIPIPESIHDRTKPFVSNESMCGSCAYHHPLSADEIEYEKVVMMLRPHGHHPCHERAQSWCVGSVDTVKSLNAGLK
jgi:hypothetical protein